MWEFIAPHILYNNLSTNFLKIDEAFLIILSDATKPLFLYSVSDECVKCPASRWQVIKPGWDVVTFSTYMDVRWRVLREDVGPLANLNETSLASMDRPDVGQFGVYQLDCNDERCDFSEVIKAVDTNISVLYALLLALFVAWIIYFNRKFIERLLLMVTDSKETFPAHSGIINTDEGNPSSTKLRSLDVFRGLMVVIMLFCSYNGGQYWWMAHATWNGLGLADLFMPGYLFVMGVCVPLSLNNSMASSAPKGELIDRALRRLAKLYFLGLMMNTYMGYWMQTIRYMSVLLRFGIGYFFVSTMYILMAHPLVLTYPLKGGRFRTMFHDVLALGRQWLVALIAVALHLAIVYGLKVPDCQRGYVGPGGNHEWGIHRYCTGGVSGYIDRHVLGYYHLPGNMPVYDSKQPFDPEGLVGCILTCVHVFLGVQCGVTILVYNNWKERIVRFLLWSLLYGLLGGILCGFQIEDGPIPINKKLWSLSFVLVTTAISYLGLALIYLLVDVTRWWSGNPIRWAGLNPILIYFWNLMMQFAFPFHWRIGSMNTHFVWLLESIWSTGVWLAVAWFVHRKQKYSKMVARRIKKCA